jgi:hypothetical protein
LIIPFTFGPTLKRQKREAVLKLLRERPDLPGVRVAELCGVTRSAVWCAKRELATGMKSGLAG